jgi:hypothetical protein
MGTNFRLGIEMRVPSRVKVVAAVVAAATRESVHDAGSKLGKFLGVTSTVNFGFFFLLLFISWP